MMNIHEYQAKEFLKQFSLPILPFGVASNKNEAKNVINQLKLQKAVLKVQIHAGGRNKAGGVLFANSPQEIIQNVDKLLGIKIINNQTGKRGIVANKILIEEQTEIDKEYYVGITIDREIAKPILIVSAEGGCDIENIPKEKILTLPIDNELDKIIKFMKWEGIIAKQGMDIITNLIKAFKKSDATLLEINPLAKNKQGKLVLLDAKINIDDNALFRQKELANCYDPTQSPKQEVLAKEYDLSYISLDGNIGCMVNGAGLAMATMDLISQYGGTPANFLDVGGGASKEKIAAGFEIISSDSNVKAILINIFGGIMNCQTIAEGIIRAKTDLPIVVRLEGTNAELARETLKQSNLEITEEKDFADAAKKVVEICQY